MKKYLFLISFLLLVFSSVKAELIPYENAVEILKLDVAISKDGKGYVAGRECPNCTLNRFTVAPAVTFYWNGKKLPLVAANRMRSKTATLFYEIESKQLTRIEGYEQ